MSRNNQRIRPFSSAVRPQNGVLVCREQESLRFHLRRYSHLVLRPWRRVGVAAEVELEAQEGLAVEQAEQPETPAAGPTQLNLPGDKAVRVEIPLPNLPAARARIVSIHQARELGQEAPVPALAARGVRAARADSDNLTSQQAASRGQAVAIAGPWPSGCSRERLERSLPTHRRGRAPTLSGLPFGWLQSIDISLTA
jgi:hypothetical protein